MSLDALTLYKLMILYMLDRAAFAPGAGRGPKKKFRPPPGFLSSF